jgi:hypothetical protein
MVITWGGVSARFRRLSIMRRCCPV